METNRKTILQRTTAKKIQAFLEGEERKALLVTGARQVGKTTLRSRTISRSTSSRI